MKEISGTRQMQDGRKVYTTTWLPDGPARINIILVHGIGEHCGRYQHVAEFLTGTGCAVCSFDHIGHGRSDGKRGCMSYEDAFSIISSLKGELKEQFPDIPIVVYGHSMGGGVVLSYGTQLPRDVAGIIATSPAVGMTAPLKPALVKMLRQFKKIAPNFTVSNGLEVEGVSRDKTVVEKYIADPLNHNRVSVTLGLDLIDWENFLRSYDQEYPVPLFLAQGSEDKLVDPKAAEDFALNLRGDVTYKRFEGGYHELHNEPNQQELFDAIEEWLARFS